MAKAQGKKAGARSKTAPKKVAARVKKVAKPTSKKATPKKAAPKPSRPAKAVKKPAPKAKKAKPAKKAAVKVKAAAKAVVKTIAKTAKQVVAPKAAEARTAPAAPVAAPARPPAAAVAEKKRGRRARPRVISSGAPAAAWLSTEKPRPASFIPAPPRAEAPSAIAAPPASSDRLIRPEDLTHLAVRTVPVRIDVEQGPGRFFVMPYPQEVTVRVGEGIEWDFRYVGGADVTVDEIVIEFEKPSPFPHLSFRTRKPGGARPHRQLSGGALPAAAGKRVQYIVRAMNAFKTEVGNTTIAVNITP